MARMERMMAFVMGRMNAGVKEGVMGMMMQRFFDELDAADKLKVMHDLMPRMMAGCRATMGSQDVFHMMHVMMPAMLEQSVEGMDVDERRRMFRMCRELLNQLENQTPPVTS